MKIESVNPTLEAINDRISFHSRKSSFYRISYDFLEPFAMLSLGDCEVVSALLANGLNGFEPKSLRIWSDICLTSELVLDIGAYTGIYSLAACSSNGNLRVLAFEPQPTTYGRLITNTIANCLDDRISPINLAASKRSGELMMSLDGGVYTMSSGETLVEPLNDKYKLQRQVKTISVDEILTNSHMFQGDHLNFDIDGMPVGAVKIDVEGFEDHVLEGMRMTLMRYHPTLLVEILDPTKTQEIIRHCDGYSLFWIDELNGISTSWSVDSRNALLIHKTKETAFKEKYSWLKMM